MEVSEEILKAAMDQVPQGPIYSSPRQVTTSEYVVLVELERFKKIKD